MKIECVWQEKMKFTTMVDAHRVTMDASAPLGSDAGPTPKQLLLISICGCTAMDVVALMKKHKQVFTEFKVEAWATPTDGHPVVFSVLELVFKMIGQVDSERLLEAVKLSQTKYCGVSAMVSGVVPIRYRVELNGSGIGDGRADFGFNRS